MRNHYALLFFHYYCGSDQIISKEKELALFFLISRINFRALSSEISPAVFVERIMCLLEKLSRQSVVPFGCNLFTEFSYLFFFFFF